jgi:hypothetical protein
MFIFCDISLHERSLKPSKVTLTENSEIEKNIKLNLIGDSGFN